MYVDTLCIMQCTQHGADCRYYQHDPANVSLDLGYWAGRQGGLAFAEAHEPTVDLVRGVGLPIADWRDDLAAHAIRDAVVSRWCVLHPWEERIAAGLRGCCATHNCQIALLAHLRGEDVALYRERAELEDE